LLCVFKKAISPCGAFVNIHVRTVDTFCLSAQQIPNLFLPMHPFPPAPAAPAWENFAEAPSSHFDSFATFATLGCIVLRPDLRRGCFDTPLLAPSLRCARLPCARPYNLPISRATRCALRRQDSIPRLILSA